MEELELVDKPKRNISNLTNEERVDLAFKAIALDNAKDLAYLLANGRKQDEGRLLYRELKYWFDK